jgi:hypothetical protein
VLHHSRSARRALVALTAVALALTACGGDDEADEAASATTEAATTTPSTTTAATDAPATTAAATDETGTTAAAGAEGSTATTAAEGDDTGDTDTIIVESFEDMPQECRDLLADFLRTIEPAVQDVDWETATIGDFQTISDDLAAEFQSMDERVTETGCDAYDFAEDADSIAPMIALAEEEAPGTVEWLEFLATLDDDPVANADLPTDCDGAIAYIDELVAGGATMNDIPFTDMTDVSQVMNVIATNCDPAVVSEFYARPEITAFLG